MTVTNISVVNAPPSTLGEGPMWSSREQALYWIDIVGKKVFRFRPAVDDVDSRDLPYAPGAVFPHANGGLLLVTKKGMALFDYDAGRLQTIPIPAIDFSVEIFNDGRCDRSGRLWIGTRHFERTEPKGGLYRLSPGMSLTRQSSGFVVSNGMAWSPDGRTLYHIETRPGRVYAYDFDLQAGTASNRRTFIEYGDRRQGHPDGCTIDCDGGLWIAEVDGSCVARYTPDGVLDREIALPVSRPTSVMFGGKDLSILYITSMRFGLSADRLAQEPHAGCVFAIVPGVKGLPECIFGSPAASDGKNSA